MKERRTWRTIERPRLEKTRERRRGVFMLEKIGVVLVIAVIVVVVALVVRRNPKKTDAAVEAGKRIMENLEKSVRRRFTR